MIIPVVADMNHANSVNFTEIAGAGIWGVIHKGRQGVAYGDPEYRKREIVAKSMGLLWKPYDFATGDDPAANVASFISFTGATAMDGGCLDFEDNTHSEMSGAQALEFLDRFNQKIGVACWLYGGNRIREQVDPQHPKWIDMAKITPLWECRYIGGQPVDNGDEWKRVPPIPPWTKVTLIQYTGDGAGPRPHTVPGLENGADLNIFDGDRNALAAAWPGPVTA